MFYCDSLHRLLLFKPEPGLEWEFAVTGAAEQAEKGWSKLELNDFGGEEVLLLLSKLCGLLLELKARFVSLEVSLRLCFHEFLFGFFSEIQQRLVDRAFGEGRLRGGLHPQPGQTGKHPPAAGAEDETKPAQLQVTLKNLPAFTATTTTTPN